jgi:hypothetical protein
MLAPPAPETVAAGAVAPPRAEEMRPVLPGRPGLAARLGASPAPDGDLDPLDGPLPVPGGMVPPDGPRGPLGRPGGPTPPPPHALAGGPNGPVGPNGPARLGGVGSQDGIPRPPLPIPGSAVPGLGDPLTEREARRDQPGRPGLIDPDEPTEGLRLLQ